VIGPEELASGQVRVKEMATGAETAVGLEDLPDWLAGSKNC